MKLDENGILWFDSGESIANVGYSGLSLLPGGAVGVGYDEVVLEVEKLTPAQRKEIADYMIEVWRKWGHDQGLVDFKSLDSYNIPGRGLVYAVTLDRTTHNFQELVGKAVLVDGKRFLCNGVERFAHSPPWFKGEKVGLLVTPIFEEPA